jgi:hypothetical protein
MHYDIVQANLDDKYAQREYPKHNPVIDASKHEWSNYFLCGYRGVLEAVKRDADLAGFSALVHGTVPIVRTPFLLSNSLLHVVVDARGVWYDRGPDFQARRRLCVHLLSQRPLLTTLMHPSSNLRTFVPRLSNMSASRVVGT